MLADHPCSFSEVEKAVRTILNAGDATVNTVCFDFFDTLVHRRVAPEQTKKLAAWQLASLTDKISGDTIYELRRELEKKLCNMAVTQGRSCEFILPELAGELFIHLNRLEVLQHDLDRQHFLDIFCNIEIQVEKTVQYLRKETVSLLKNIRKKGLRTCLVSDFYLPGELFSELLRFHGLDSLFDHLFISADFRRAKADGTLYPEVCQTLNLAPEQLLMIGDNPQADGVMATKHGIAAILVDADTQKEKYLEMQRSAPVVSQDLCEERFDQTFRANTDSVFKEMGVSLWLFIHKLFHTTYHKGVRNLFFCSKEGELLKHLFDQYQDLRFGQRPIVTHYLLVSRKATFICSLAPLDEEDFGQLFQQYRDLSLTEFVLSLNFSRHQLDELKTSLACDWDSRLPEIANRPEFHNLLKHPRFRELYESQRQIQRQNLLSYLRSFPCDFEQEGFHMVDVGWKGSIQNNLHRLLQDMNGSPIRVSGYYLGLLTPGGLSETNSKQGILFSDYPRHTEFVHVYNSNRSLFEMMLGASHGSADGYFTREQFTEIGATRGSTIHHWTDSSPEIGISVLDLPEERQLFNETIQPLQTSFITIGAQLTKTFLLTGGKHPDNRWFAKHHARMCFHPTREEVELFANLYHLENFGLFEFTTFDGTDHIPILRRLSNLLHLLKNRSAILETGVWQPIILRRLGLSFLQPLDGRRRYRRIFGESQ